MGEGMLEKVGGVRWSRVWILLLLLLPCWAWGGAVSQFDISRWKFDQNGAFDLTGDWELYWDELREPGTQTGLPPQMAPLPSSWVFHPNLQLPAYGVATYRTWVKLPADGRAYGLHLEWIFSAYRVFWNGKLLREVGVVGRTPATTSGQILRETLMLPSEPGVNNELVIQVANFSYHKPGIVVAPEIDLYNSLLVERERSLTLQMFIAGAIFLMGVYHFGLFVLRRNDYSVLFFGGLSFVVSIFIWISGDGFYSYSEYVPNNVWWFIYFLCWILGVAMVQLFTHSIFPAYGARKLNLVFLAISGGGIIGIIVFPVRLYFELNGIIQWMHMFLAVYLLYIGVRAAIDRADGSLFFILATLVIALCVGNDILVTEQKIKSVYLTGRGVFIFVCLQSFILAQRHAKAYQTVKEHSVELESLKQNLEKQVEARTSALHIALKETRKMNERLINISRTDALTGVFNRRYFVERLDEEWRRAMRERNRIVLLIIDIDHFKQFNDRYGHLCGDHCLRHVGTLLKQHFQRAVDFVARYGGEEFAVLIYGDSTDNVFQVAERLRAEINERPFEFDGQKLFVTLSMGIGELIPTADFRQDSLIRIADNAMYKAKATGRNRVVRADLPNVRDL